ncbi:type II secretion system protein [Undibacterium amnicola]|uniref:Type II secretion system protein n=1 Tax=Undibacterium amnicola TaxID=1834038 RepID=A0ABR6XTU1_9BURK|nr:type II secretion system protein [Undibacterium amnicola]MBC3832900.1 type II secretion system protein [Undibacterium amnicola]
MRKQQGFSYLIALFLVSMVAVVSVRAMENLASSERHDKETELLWVGQAYKKAIRQYYENSPGTVKKFPKELAQLLMDDRATKIARPLRRLYRDPITASDEWGIIRDQEGGIMGVYSLSTVKPFKTAGFPADLVSFTGATRYSDWHFIYQP